jgi:hypothetical protein
VAQFARNSARHVPASTPAREIETRLKAAPKMSMCRRQLAPTLLFEREPHPILEVL